MGVPLNLKDGGKAVQSALKNEKIIRSKDVYNLKQEGPKGPRSLT